MIEQVKAAGKVVSILFHMGTNNAEREFKNPMK